MTVETVRQFAALEAQAARIMAVFTRAGYEAVAPAVIQPAGVFLDAIGEALRARTYVFTDQDGAELCLRPDLTVPTCRLHLARSNAAANPAKYCYNGAAFRYQTAGANAAHPREFRQAGIESFGGSDPIQAEAETLALMVEALAAAGLKRAQLHLKFGDLELVRALLAALDMPAHWRARLQAKFWRPAAFRAELKRLTENPAGHARTLPPALLAALAPTAPREAEAVLAAHLEAAGLEPFGARSVAEVAEQARAMMDDAYTVPLPAATAGLIESYIAIEVACRGASAQIAALAAHAGIDLKAPLARFDARLDRLEALGLDLNHATFSGDFGRSLAYYTGFVFEITAPGLPDLSPVAGGGRYDGLMRLAGSPVDVPAVGAAIHTERLLAAIAGGVA